VCTAWSPWRGRDDQEGRPLRAPRVGKMGDGGATGSKGTVEVDAPHAAHRAGMYSRCEPERADRRGRLRELEASGEP